MLEKKINRNVILLNFIFFHTFYLDEILFISNNQDSHLTIIPRARVMVDSQKARVE